MLYYKTMDTKTIVMCVVALILGMLMANMLKSVCGCNVVEGNGSCLTTIQDPSQKQKHTCAQFDSKAGCTSTREAREGASCQWYGPK